MAFLWRIRKVLVQGDESELVIPEEAAAEHILKHLSPAMRAQVDSNAGLRIPVVDYDTCETFKLMLKRQQQLQGVFPGGIRCVLTGGWSENFAGIRDLINGDEIGLFWSTLCDTLVFTLLIKYSRIRALMRSFSF